MHRALGMSAGLGTTVLGLTREQGLHFVDGRRRQPGPGVAALVGRWQQPVEGGQPPQGHHQQLVRLLPAAGASCPSCTSAQ